MEEVMYFKADKESFGLLKELFPNDFDGRRGQLSKRSIDIYAVAFAGRPVGRIVANYTNQRLDTETLPGVRVNLSHFILIKEYRMRGLGSGLLSFALEDLAARGYSEFTVGVEDENAAAKHIYSGNGFTEKIDHGSDPCEYDLYLKRIARSGSEELMTNKSTARAARRGDWKTVDMPGMHETFVLHRVFGDAEMEALRLGNIPRAMEDKWFWYMEGSTLWAHRSWTGYCIFRIDFKEDNAHLVTVNRDPEQYASAGIEEDAASLNKLLDWWTNSPYDHYNEWLSEVHDALKGSGGER